MQKKYCVNCFYILAIEADICSRCDYPQGGEESPLYLRPPYRLLDQFYIGRVLGQGGFAITYLAYDKNLSTLCAIKEYFPIDFASRAADGQAVMPYLGQASELFQVGKEKFISEARLLASFRSPNIIKIRQFFLAQNTAYFVMEYLKGCTLSELIRNQGGKLSYAEVQALIPPLLDALKEVHHKNVFHRDIKPDNIYITQSGEPILLDFGAARQSLSNRTTHLGAFLTPGFAPAEQYSTNGIQGPWTDIYALAATLYYALTGHLPPTPSDRLLGEAELLPPSQLGADIPARDEEWLLQALAVQWSKRPDSIDQWRSQLDSTKIVLLDPEVEARRAEENFTKIAILPKLSQRVLIPRDEQAIYDSAAYMEIPPLQVRDLIEAALESTGSERLNRDPESEEMEAVRQREAELRRKEAELHHFEELRNKEEALWWDAEMADRDAEKQALEVERRRQEELERQFNEERQKQEQALRKKAEELRYFEDLRRKEEEIWYEYEMAERDAQNQAFEAEQQRKQEELRRIEDEKLKLLEDLQQREAELKRKEAALLEKELQLQARPAASSGPEPRGLSTEELDELEEISDAEIEEVLQLFQRKSPKARPAAKSAAKTAQAESQAKPKVESEPPAPRKVQGPIPVGSTLAAELDAYYARLKAEKFEVPAAPRRLVSRSQGLPERVSNALGMEFVLIDPLKSDFALRQAFSVGPMELGFEIMSIKPFYMLSTPVSQQHWQYLLYNQPAGFSDDPLLPVEQVSWEDCQLFVSRLNQLQEAAYRLPAEVEWAFACGLAQGQPYFWGSDPIRLEQHEWFADNSDGRSHQVGLKKPNPLGLYDLLGNVREWCQDAFLPLTDAEYARQMAQPARNLRVVRGGGWNGLAAELAASFRSPEPAHQRLANLGFRLVFDPD